MAFWSEAGSEPKRNYRWYVNFAGGAGVPADSLSNMSYALKKMTKPKSKVGAVTHKYLNHFFHYPGRLEWEDVQITFASITKPDATYLINKVLLNAGYGVPTNNLTPDQLATIGKRKFNGSLGNTLDLIQVDANGQQIEKWALYNPFFVNVSYGELDYSNEEITDIQVTVKYDYAQLATVKEPTESDQAPNLVNPSFPTPVIT